MEEQLRQRNDLVLPLTAGHKSTRVNKAIRGGLHFKRGKLRPQMFVKSTLTAVDLNPNCSVDAQVLFSALKPLRQLP